MTAYLSLLVAVVGALVYALSANQKTSEMGKLAYFAGLLAFLLLWGGKTIEALK